LKNRRAVGGQLVFSYKLAFAYKFSFFQCPMCWLGSDGAAWGPSYAETNGGCLELSDY
jgi:hypothetical protein